MKYIIANWKAHMNPQTTEEWIETFLSSLNTDTNLSKFIHSGDRSVIVCPPYPFLLSLKKIVNNTSIYCGSQDLSQFEEGSYTGDVTAKSLSGLVSYSIIGHSERRHFYKETDEMIATKTELAAKNAIKTIVCIRGTSDQIPEKADIIAYEPVEAIGSGRNESVEDVIKMKKHLAGLNNKPFIYGGSVTPENVAEYLNAAEIDGVLVGTASLDPQSFAKIVSA